MSGFTQQEISKYDLCRMSNEDLHNIVKQRLLGIMSQNGTRQKVIDVQEIERYVSEGWEYVTAVSQDRAVVKLPF